MFKNFSLIAFGSLFILTGILHFIFVDFMVAIVPPVFPAKFFLVYASGLAEMVLGVLIFISKFKKIAAWFLILLLLAVFPANIYMYMARDQFNFVPQWLLLLRLPSQFLLIYWAYGFTK